MILKNGCDNMTVKLYDQDAYQTVFEAQVITCTKRENDYDVVLDQTLFFPEEGGQTCDRGTLNEVEVIDVQIINQEIHHYTKAPLSGNVKGKIDFDYRYNNMQNHSGEHVLSGLVKSLFGFDNSGFHLSDNEITTDYNGFLNEQQLQLLEDKANEVILKNITIHCFYPDNIDLYDYRSKKEINEAIRLVEIEDVDCCACCAPHVHSTSEIGMIKILKAMKHKNGIRLYFVCGHRAFVDYQNKHIQAINISQKLSLPPNDLIKGIDQLLNENNQLKQELSNLKKQMIDQQIQSLSKQDHYLIFTKDLDRSLQQYYLNQLFTLCSNYVGIFVGENENYRFMIASNNDSRDLLNKLKDHFEIKGGGKANMVQGQIKGNQKTIQDILENN